MRKQYVVTLTALVLILALTACGAAPTATPQPTDTPAPTDTPVPSRTPEPTVDIASLGAPELYATIEALQEELAYEEQHLQSASGSDGASVQALIEKLRTEIQELTELAEERAADED